MTMKIELGEITIRNFVNGDAGALWEIVREPDITRFMGDWRDNSPTPQSFYPYFERMASIADGADVRRNRRYGIALAATDELVGMVGAGLEQTLGEVEVAYFMSGRFRRRGYTRRAVCSLCEHIFAASDIPYLILTADSDNAPSCALAERCGFETFELRTPLGHTQPNIVSKSYYYYRLYRTQPDGRSGS